MNIHNITKEEKKNKRKTISKNEKEIDSKRYIHQNKEKRHCLDDNQEKEQNKRGNKRDKEKRKKTRNTRRQDKKTSEKCYDALCQKLI